MPNRHFIAKLTPGGGPEPLAELDNIVLAVGDAETPLGWLGTKRGAGWSAHAHSICIVIAKNVAQGCFDVVVARVVTATTATQESTSVIDAAASDSVPRGVAVKRRSARIRASTGNAVTERAAPTNKENSTIEIRAGARAP